jgi:hypothetical protein
MRIDILKERIAYMARETRIGELGTLAVFLRRVLQLLVTANIVPLSPILVTMMMGAICSS